MLAPAVAGLIDRGIAAFGGGITLTIVRPVNLFDPVSDAGAVLALELVDPVIAGATTLRLARPSSAPLAGGVPAGLVLSIDGAEDVEVEEVATAAAGSNELVVAVSALIGSYAAGTAVTHGGKVELAYSALQQNVRLDMLNERVVAGDELFVLTPIGHTTPPQPGDLTSTGRQIVTALPVDPARDATLARWRVQVGRR